MDLNLPQASLRLLPGRDDRGPLAVLDTVAHVQDRPGYNGWEFLHLQLSAYGHAGEIGGKAPALSEAIVADYWKAKALIDAARDLLAGAKRMSQAFAEHAANHPALGAAVEELRAAIAKAEGRAPA